MRFRSGCATTFQGPSPQTEPPHPHPISGLEGCGDPASGCQVAWLEDRSFATRPPERLSVEKSRIGDSGRGCVWGGLFPHKRVLFEGQMSKCSFKFPT